MSITQKEQFPASSVSLAAAFQIIQRLGQAGLSEKMVEPGRQQGFQALMLSHQGFRQALKFSQMRRRITVPEGMIRNGSQPLTQQSVKEGKFRIHSNVSKRMKRKEPFRNLGMEKNQPTCQYTRGACSHE